MTMYKVRVPHVFRDGLGRPDPKMPDDAVEICNKRVAMKLLQQGVIESDDLPPRGILPDRSPIDPITRVGVYMHTSSFYSGGRIHIHQMAWCMANMGAEVFIVTNAHPRWSTDYRKHPNLKILSGAEAGKVPKDIDLLFSDGKNMMGRQVVQRKLENLNIPLVLINFETPNWVAEFDPNTASRMENFEDTFKHADMMLCNSEESLKYLHQYMRVTVPTGVVPPAANTHAVDKNVASPLPPEARGVPYVVWSARSSTYKGGHVICDAVMNYPKPLNLVLIGKPSTVPKSTELHKVFSFKVPITDAEKMRVMRDAVCVAAPSKFEGFGMVPAEAMSNGTPVLAYDLPVLRQGYGDRIQYADWGDEKQFAQKLYDIVDGKTVVEVDAEEVRRTYGMEAMEKDMAERVPYFNFNRRRVSAQMICYYGPMVQEAIASVYPHVDEIVIAHGPTELWKDFPADDSLQLIQNYPDPEGKIKVDARKVWKNKGEMRTACQRMATGNHILIVDADEIYHGLDAWIEHAPSFGCRRWVHFWHDLDHYVVDPSGNKRWGAAHELGGSVHNHLRWAYWRNSNRWNERGTAAMGSGNMRISSGVATAQAVEAVPQCCIYHLGHVLDPVMMKAKHDFYIARDGAGAGRVQRAAAWSNWKGELGDCGDGLIRQVFWEVPELVRSAYARVVEVADA